VPRRPRSALALRRALRRLRSHVSRRALLGLGLGVALWLGINASVRALGGDVHPLSLSRLRERGQALVLLGVHTVRCRAPVDDAASSLREAARRHGVPPRLVLSVARAESSLIHTRISGTGAMGLMQLMPDTAFELGVTDPFDVAQSADGGARYLAQLLALYAGDTRRAVAAYNVGLGRVPARGQLALPRETRVYVARVLAGM
jgi:soluble lytic murein transglycosylase-like protein